MSDALPYSNMGCLFCALTTFPDTTNYFSSAARSAELQYRRSGTGYATQWGLNSVRSPLDGVIFGSTGVTNVAQQVYMDWQQVLNPRWQLEGGLAWGKNDKLYGTSSTHLQRKWVLDVP